MIIQKIKDWYWWRFKATYAEKVVWCLYEGKSPIVKLTEKGYDFIDHKKFFIDPSIEVRKKNMNLLIDSMVRAAHKIYKI